MPPASWPVHCTGEGAAGQPRGCRQRSRSRPSGASSAEENSIERVRSADEQAVLPVTAKREVGHQVWHQDLAQQASAGIDAMHAVGGAGPDVAILIHAAAIGKTRFHLVEDLAAMQLALRVHVEGTDVLFGV